MIIYMTHPQHGAMHVYAEAHAVENEKNGWVRATEEKNSCNAAYVQVEQTQQTQIEGVSSQSPIDKYIEKYGQRPHHRMKPETIERMVAE